MCVFEAAEAHFQPVKISSSQLFIASHKTEGKGFHWRSRSHVSLASSLFIFSFIFHSSRDGIFFLLIIILPSLHHLPPPPPPLSTISTVATNLSTPGSLLELHRIDITLSVRGFWGVKWRRPPTGPSKLTSRISLDVVTLHHDGILFLFLTYRIMQIILQTTWQKHKLIYNLLLSWQQIKHDKQDWNLNKLKMMWINVKKK